MVFIYAFKKAEINYLLYKAEEHSAQDYLSELCETANSNLLIINEKCGEQLGEIVKNYVKSFNSYVAT